MNNKENKLNENEAKDVNGGGFVVDPRKDVQYTCAGCGHSFTTKEETTYDGRHYCPNCKASMKKEDYEKDKEYHKLY